jgi:hypothetical protein
MGHHLPDRGQATATKLVAIVGHRHPVPTPRRRGHVGCNLCGRRRPSPAGSLPDGCLAHRAHVATPGRCARSSTAGLRHAPQAPPSPRAHVATPRRSVDGVGHHLPDRSQVVAGGDGGGLAVAPCPRRDAGPWRGWRWGSPAGSRPGGGITTVAPVPASRRRGRCIRDGALSAITCRIAARQNGWTSHSHLTRIMLDRSV